MEIMFFLFIDILALCTGMRPVVMVDYGGKLPELKDRLCMLLQQAHKVLFYTNMIHLNNGI